MERPRCVWCGCKHDGPLLLCEVCEEKAKAAKEARGEKTR